MRQVVEEFGSARPNRQPAVVQDFACPTRRVVEELDFVRPTLRLVAAVPGFAPSQEFVVEKQDFVCPNPGLVVEPGPVRPTLRPVALDFAHPRLLVVAEHPMSLVIALVAPRDLLPA
jgi:hypothetical protein